jgi:LytS/YehU family sensor histidine kinase
MQARVEPQFLFNTLLQVRDLYRASASRGEQMLDELIAYLRAAMPKMRDTSSTIGQELDLVRAYLGIVSLRLGERLVFEIVDSGIGFVPGNESERIAGIRERLSALYGADASLVLRRREASATEAVLEIRYEPGAPLVEGAS